MELKCEMEAQFEGGNPMSATSVGASTASVQEARPGASPWVALHALHIAPIPISIAKTLVTRNHYLHSLPGGTQLAFGAFLDDRLMGALTIGCGPSQAYRLVDDASAGDCAVLTRLWLSDELPHNSESRVIGIVLRALRKYTSLKFLISYADPSQGHVGIIYQATGWLYTGLSEATPLYDLGDGIPRHSRSFSHSFGSHSVRHFARHGVELKLVAQAAKHRYVYFLDLSFRHRLNVPMLPYPRREGSDEAR